MPDTGALILLDYGHASVQPRSTAYQWLALTLFVLLALAAAAPSHRNLATVEVHDATAISGRQYACRRDIAAMRSIAATHEGHVRPGTAAIGRVYRGLLGRIHGWLGCRGQALGLHFGPASATSPSVCAGRFDGMSKTVGASTGPGLRQLEHVTI